ncbi:ribonuclease Z [Legionella steigerwaltii]|uniref:Ribonuclease Z n=1 Tax=Legionella steigerwaltii TaxID=460 RepID=A0A378LK18_9GAMM|nr:MBL fold metallo-hydrolase [Legionella steigerwaltii]KTD78024.1 ribonuclease Z [Legionella steigerwaltii]STY24421.1 ribonuclease Z [Legionella steigerwaltii]
MEIHTQKQLCFYVVHEDPNIIKLIANELNASGHKMFSTADAADVLVQVNKLKPDYILIEHTLTETIKKLCNSNKYKVVLLSLDPSRQNISPYKLGAQGCIYQVNQMELFTKQLNRIIEDKIDMEFWGVTGAFPAPGENFIKYGGHTSCITLNFVNERTIILDAGSGIIPLGDELITKKQNPIEADIFITHQHWDHIHGLTFFKPLYHPQNRFNFYGPPQGVKSVHELLSGLMDGIYFPVKIDNLPSIRSYHDLIADQKLEIDNIRISTIALQHPCVTYGYKIQYNNKIISYITDNELYDKSHHLYNADFVRNLIQFTMGSDILIIDCSFTDEEYDAGRVSWGHSCPRQVAEFAHLAHVKQLILHHNDHHETDQVVDTKLMATQKLLSELGSKTRCIAPEYRHVVRI